MKIIDFNKKIHKITSLSANVQGDNHISTLERDLLLSYIRELYELVLDEQPITIKRETKAQGLQEEEIIQNSGDNVVPFTQAPPVQAATITLHPPQPTAPQEAAQEFSTEVREIKVEDAPKILEIPKAVEKAVSHQEPTQNDAIAEIFADEAVTDLSDRLSHSPIADLTKPMGINERIFTQQELFKNDSIAFNEVLTKLNQAQNFLEAKRYLVEQVIDKYGWTSENKVKKAATFVRLIKRKYI